VRSLPLLLCFLLALAACGSDDRPEAAITDPALGWAGPSDLRPRDGTLDRVEGFRAYVEIVNRDWKNDPEGVAREYLLVGEGDASVDGTTVTILRDRLEDDSIRAERWVLELERAGEGWQLVSARWEQRCQLGRGHQSFGPSLCL